MAKKTKFYAVKAGHKTGVFTSWMEFNAAVKGHPYPCFCFFFSMEEARKYLADGNPDGRAENNIKHK